MTRFPGGPSRGSSPCWVVSRARVIRKGGAVGHDRVADRQCETPAQGHLKGRIGGPLFVTARRARTGGTGDRDPEGRARLSYEQAEALFKK